MRFDFRGHLQSDVTVALIKSGPGGNWTWHIKADADRRVLNRGFYGAIVGALKCLP